MGSPRTEIEQELQLKSDALEHSLNGFDIVDAEGRFIYANRAYLDMWGYDRLDEIVGTSAGGHCADPAVPGQIIGALKTRGECTLEFVARRRDGSTFEVRMWARLAHDSNGREIYPTTSIDITGERRAARTGRLLSEVMEALISEVNLERALERVAQVVVPDLADCCILDLADDATTAALRTVALWHQRPEKRAQLAGLWPRTIQDPSSRVVSVFRTGTPELHPSADGRDELGIRSSLSAPLRARGRTLGVLTLLIDEGLRRFDEGDLKAALLLSDRVALAADNALLLRNAQAAILSRDEFISVCSHELKTPVTSMKLQFQTAKHQIQAGQAAAFDPQRVTKRVDLALRQLQRMSKLIDDMLDVSRITTGRLALEFERVDLGLLLQEVIERFSEQFSALNVPLSLDRPPREVVVRGDWLRLDQVLTNLLTNALKYGGGRPVAVALSADDETAELRVQDRGIGIAPADRDRVFKRFERIASTASVGGLGLGLYISREIVDAHGGTIEVLGDPEDGTTFVVRLKLERAPRVGAT